MASVGISDHTEACVNVAQPELKMAQDVGRRGVAGARQYKGASTLGQHAGDRSSL